MKKVISGFFLVFAFGCAKQNQTPGSGNQLLRDLVNGSSSARTMRNESKDIADNIEDVAGALQKLSDECDGLGEQVAAFNDALSARTSQLVKLLEEREDLINSLRGAQADFDAATDQEQKLNGQIRGITKRLGFLAKPSTLASMLSAEKRSLLRQRNIEKRNARIALKALGRAEFPSDDFDRAEADLRAARSAIVDIDNQLKILGQTVAANLAAEIESLNAQLPGLQRSLAAAQMARIAAEPFVVNFRARLKAKQREVKAVQRFEDLEPFTVPAICEKL